MEANDINTILQLVNSGRWATVLMGSSIFNYPELKAVTINAEGVSRQATVIWSTDSYRKKSAQILLELLEIHAKVL